MQSLATTASYQRYKPRRPGRGKPLSLLGAWETCAINEEIVVGGFRAEKEARVYDEMAQIVRNRFQSQNLIVRAAVAVRAKQ